MKLYLTLPLALWMLIALSGVLVASGVLRIALRNFDRESVEPSSLRYLISRAHLRRVLIRMVRLLMNLGAGVLASLTPSPLLHQVAVLEVAVGAALVIQAALDTLDLILDFAVARRLYADRPLPDWFSGIFQTVSQLVGGERKPRRPS